VHQSFRNAGFCVAESKRRTDLEAGRWHPTRQQPPFLPRTGLRCHNVQNESNPQRLCRFKDGVPDQPNIECWGAQQPWANFFSPRPLAARLPATTLPSTWSLWAEHLPKRRARTNTAWGYTARCGHSAGCDRAMTCRAQHVAPGPLGARTCPLFWIPRIQKRIRKQKAKNAGAPPPWVLTHSDDVACDLLLQGTR
jgi:hypothetical protein